MKIVLTVEDDVNRAKSDIRRDFRKRQLHSPGSSF